MPVSSLCLELTYIGPGTILLDDIHDAFDARNQRVLASKPGALYLKHGIPASLIFTSDVAISYEVGKIRRLIDDGRMTDVFVVGAKARDGIIAAMAQEPVSLPPGTGDIPSGSTFIRVDTSVVGTYDLYLPDVCDPLSSRPMTFTHDDGEAPVRLRPNSPVDGVDGPPGSTFLLTSGESITFCAFCTAPAGDEHKWIRC